MDSGYEKATDAENKGADRPKILTLDEVADYLRVHRSTVYRMAREGTIPSIKVANQWRFHQDRIDRWLIDREEVPESAQASAPERRRAVGGN